MKFSLPPAAFLALLLRTPSAVDGAGEGTFYTYYDLGGLGPGNWPLLDMDQNQCGGTGGSTGYGQSPIAVPSMECTTDLAGYSFTPGNCDWNDLYFSLSNNGVKVEPLATSTCTFGEMTIPNQDLPYRALQYHIHTYSEHSIAGSFFPAELHVVHARTDGADFAVFGTMIDVNQFDATHEVFDHFLAGWETEAARVDESCTSVSLRALRGEGEFDYGGDGRRKLATLQKLVDCPDVGSGGWVEYRRDLQGELEEEGSNPVEPGEAVPDLISEVPEDTVEGTDAATDGDEDELPVNPAPYSAIPDPTFPDTPPDIYGDLPNAPDFGIYTYRGGLTTPPCTEIVNWNLLDRPMTISKSQLARLEKLIMCYTNAATCQHETVASETGSTSRPPQELLGRTVNRRCPGGPEEVRGDSVPVIVLDADEPDDGIFMEDDDQYDTTEPRGAATMGAARAGAAMAVAVGVAALL